MSFECVLEAEPSTLTDQQKEALKILFIAKHATAGGAFDGEDGSHAVYHHEIRTILEDLCPNVEVSSDLRSLFVEPSYNYLFSLFNRAGFRNSEVFASILSEYNDVAYLGAKPTMRAVADDKFMSKILVEDYGIPVPKGHLVKYTDQHIERPDLGDRLIAKPNASSASWGICHGDDWGAMKTHIKELMDQDHDVIVEEFIPGFDVTVPVLGGKTPWILPASRLLTDDPDNVPTYEEKRGFSDGYVCEVYDAFSEFPKILEYTQRVTEAMAPFDYGRVDLRVNTDTGEVYFLETNLSCNLGSNKAIVRAANTIGLSHAQVVETILCASLERQNWQP